MPAANSTDRRNTDISYAIEELNNNTPLEDVLLEVYNRAISRNAKDDDPATYAISVLREAYDDLNQEFDEAATASPRFARFSELDETSRLYRAAGYAIQAPDRVSGIYSGDILGHGAAVTVQQTGPHTVTLHLNSDLVTPADPNLRTNVQPGQNCTIRYNDGKALVRAGQEREPTHDRERQRQ